MVRTRQSSRCIECISILFRLVSKATCRLKLVHRSGHHFLFVYYRNTLRCRLYKLSLRDMSESKIRTAVRDSFDEERGNTESETGGEQHESVGQMGERQAPDTRRLFRFHAPCRHLRKLGPPVARQARRVELQHSKHTILSLSLEFTLCNLLRYSYAWLILRFNGARFGNPQLAHTFQNGSFADVKRHLPVSATSVMIV